MEELKNKEVNQQEKKLEEKSTNALSSVDTLNKNTDDIANKIVDETDSFKLDDLTNLFNQNLRKKSILRILTYENLLDKVDKQLVDRLTKKPDEISNKELLDMLNIIHQNTDRIQKNIIEKPNIPVIQVNAQQNNINIKTNDELNLDKESREKVLEVIKTLMDSNTIDTIVSENNCILNKNTTEDVIEGSVKESQENKGENK